MAKGTIQLACPYQDVPRLARGAGVGKRGTGMAYLDMKQRAVIDEKGHHGTHGFKKLIKADE